MKYGVNGVKVKSYVLYKDALMTWDAFCEKCSLGCTEVRYCVSIFDPVENQKCAACGSMLSRGCGCIFSWESGKIWCCCQCVLDYFDAEFITEFG